MNITKEDIRIDGLLLEFCNEDVRDNDEIVEIALNNNYLAIKYVSERIKNDYTICLNLIMNTYNHKIMKYVSSNLCDNFNFVYNSISYNAYCLKYASKRLQDNYHIINKAIIINPYVLKYASNDLKNNNLIAFNAIIINHNCFKLISKNIGFCSPA